MTKIDDSRILSALLSAGTIRGAAAAAGTSESTVRNRLADADFRQRYDAARGELLQGATAAMLARLTDATEVLTEVMTDSFSANTTRLQAADTLLRHCLRYVSISEIERRIAALEATVGGFENELANTP